MLKMGNFTNLAAGCRVICGSDKFAGDGLIGAAIPVQFRDHMHSGGVTLQDFANVGSNAVLMPGVTLAEGSVVGACAMLLHDTEPWGIYVGVPARRIKTRPRETMLKYAKQLGY